MTESAEALIARLRRNPADQEAYLALKAVYGRGRDYASLVNLLEGWASRSQGKSACRELSEAAEVSHRHLQDSERAISMYRRALQHDRDSVKAWQGLEAVLQDRGEYQRVYEVLEQRASLAANRQLPVSDQAALWCRLAQVSQQTLQRPDLAIHHFSRAIQLDPKNTGAIYALRELYYAQRDFERVCQLYEMEAQAESNPARRTSLWLELSDLCLQRLADTGRAIAALKQARSTDSRNPNVLHSLATLLLQRVESASDPDARSHTRAEAAEVLYELALVVEAEHATSYCEAALDAAPHHEGALARLEQIIGHDKKAELAPRWLAYLERSQNVDGVRRRRFLLATAYREAEQWDDCANCLQPLLDDRDPAAAQLLVDVFRTQGDRTGLVRCLEILIERTAPEEKPDLLRELIRLNDELQHRDVAFQYARQLLSLMPADGETLNYFVAACNAAGEHQLLFDALLSAASATNSEAEERKGWLRRAANTATSKLADSSRAVHAWETLLAIDPGDRDALNELASLTREQENWERLAEILEQQLGTTDRDASQVSLLSELADIHEHRRADSSEAIRALRRIHALDPKDHEARRRLCELLLSVGAAVEATPLLRKRIEDAEGTERVELMEVLAQNLSGVVGDDEGAYEIYVSLLEEEVPPLPVLEKMHVIDERLGEWDRLINSLSYRCELVPDSEHPALFMRMADIAQNQLQDTSRSLSLLGRALDLSSDDSALLDTFCERHIADNLLRELVEELKGRAEKLESPTQSAEYFRRIARVLSEHVGNQEGAQEAWHEVLSRVEDIEALRFLRDRAERFGQVEDLATFTRRLSEVLESPAERRDSILEYALLLAEQLDRNEEACAILKALVQESESPDLGVLDRLADLLIRGGDLDSAREHLMLRLDNTSTDSDPLPAAQILAELARDSLEDEALETFALERWCAHHADEERARHRLHDLYLADERVEDALQCLEALIQIQGHNVGAQELNLRAAKLEIEQLDDLERAWKRLTLLLHAGHPESETYAFSVAEQNRYESELATVLIDCARQASTADLQVKRWMQAAKLYEDKVQDVSRALESTLRALAVDLTSEEVLDEADRLFILSGAWPRAAQVYSKLVTSTQSTVEQSRLLFRHAELLQEHTELYSDAFDRALRAWELEPRESSDPRFLFLEQLAESSKREASLLPLYTSLLGTNLEAAEALELSIKRLQISYRHVGLNRGHEHLHALVESCIDSHESLDAIEKAVIEVSESFGEAISEDPIRQLAETYLGMAEGQSEDEGSTLFARAAHLLTRALGDQETALDIWRAGTNLWPADDDLMDEMESFCESYDRLDALATHLEHIVSETVDSNVAARMLERWGRLLEVGMEDYEKAVGIYRKLLNLTPDDPDITRRIRRCLEHQGRHQEVLGIIRHELDRTTLPRERVQLLHEIAAIWEHDLDNRWEALDAWKAVLAEDPTHREALEALRRLGHATRKITEGANPSVEELVSDEDEVPPRQQDFSDVEESLTELDGISSVLFSSEMLDETLDPATSGDLLREDSVEAFPPREIITAHTVVADEEEDSLAFHLSELTEDGGAPPPETIEAFEDEETAMEAPPRPDISAPSEDQASDLDLLATSASGVVDLGSDLVDLGDASLEEELVAFDGETRDELPVDAEAETELTQAD